MENELIHFLLVYLALKNHTEITLCLTNKNSLCLCTMNCNAITNTWSLLHHHNKSSFVKLFKGSWINENWYTGIVNYQHIMKPKLMKFEESVISLRLLYITMSYCLHWEVSLSLQTPSNQSEVWESHDLHLAGAWWRTDPVVTWSEMIQPSKWV